MTALSKMTVDDFLAWAATQPGRWKLFDGEPVAMSPERAVHGRVKLRVANALERAIEAAGVPCQVLLDCVAVRIDRHRSYQPDVLVYCGDAVPDDALEVADPLVGGRGPVAERRHEGPARQASRLLPVPSIMHYLIVDPDKRLIIHHARGDGDVIATRIVGEASLRLDPPGIELAVADLFPPS